MPASDRLRPCLIVFGAAVLRGGVPSGTLRRRVEGAYRFAAQLPAPIYIVSGARGRFGPAEAVVMRDLLLGFGVRADDILVEEQSRDTLQTAVNSWRLLRRRPDVGQIYVCSSSYHLPRCRMLVRMLGLPAAAAPMPGDRAATGTVSWAWSVFRETIALPYDAIAMAVVRRRLRA